MLDSREGDRPLSPSEPQIGREAQPASLVPEIHFYRSDGPHYCFTNFSPHRIIVDGVTWPTVEHYFQAQKFVATDPAWAERIRQAPTPLAAAGMGQDRRHLVRADWEFVKDVVMRAALSIKLSQHADVREALVATGTALLILDSDRNYYWGCGADGSGTNIFGKILMELRTELS